MKTNKVDTKSMRNDAHFQFHTEFRNLIVKENAETLGVETLFDAYTQLYAREDEALKKVNKSALTQKIHEADKLRDETFSGMFESNKAMCKHFNPAIRDAAFRIQVVLDTYGNVAVKPLNEQTSAISNLLQDLSHNKFNDDRVKVGLNVWVNELQTRNIAFERLVEERFDEAAVKTSIVMKDARREVDEAYRRIVEQINALVLVEGVTKYEYFVPRLNAVIAKYDVKRRHRHASGQVESSGTEGDGAV